MANLAERLSLNSTGAYYVDASCIDCDQCRATAPDLFGRDEDSGMSFLRRQPVNADEIAQVDQIMAECATSSIGNDGA
jgi:ferredoxin